MRKIIKGASIAAAFASLMILGAVTYAGYAVPDSLYVTPDESETLGAVYHVDFSGKKELRVMQTGTDPQAVQEYDVDVSLLGVIPVKSAHVTVTQRKYVVPGGAVFGIRLYTHGVVVVGMDGIDTAEGKVNPAKQAGLCAGDIILKINGADVNRNQDVSKAFESSSGEEVELEIERDGEVKTLRFRPALAAADQRYRAGLWVRDSSAGVGTMTFYDRATGIFAGLGHAVCDVDTGELMPLLDGDIVDAKITGCYKGADGVPGELCGSFNSGVIGELKENGDTGVYGRLYHPQTNAEVIPVAMKQEVKTGPAQILATVDGEAPQYYDVEIKKAYTGSDSHQKNMVVEVTDAALIAKTGGIVQGMSGSPILQNGMLVGAVTHVFVNNPLQGYAIFAETMWNTAESVAQSLQNDAA